MISHGNMGAPVFARITQATNIKPVVAATSKAKAPVALTPQAIATGYGGAGTPATPATATTPAKPAVVAPVQQSFAVKAGAPVKQAAPAAGMSTTEIVGVGVGVVVLGGLAFFLLK